MISFKNIVCNENKFLSKHNNERIAHKFAKLKDELQNIIYTEI